MSALAPFVALDLTAMHADRRYRLRPERDLASRPSDAHGVEERPGLGALVIAPTPSGGRLRSEGPDRSVEPSVGRAASPGA